MTKEVVDVLGIAPQLATMKLAQEFGNLERKHASLKEAVKIETIERRSIRHKYLKTELPKTQCPKTQTLGVNLAKRSTDEFCPSSKN